MQKWNDNFNKKNRKNGSCAFVSYRIDMDYDYCSEKKYSICKHMNGGKDPMYKLESVADYDNRISYKNSEIAEISASMADLSESTISLVDTDQDAKQRSRMIWGAICIILMITTLVACLYRLHQKR